MKSMGANATRATLKNLKTIGGVSVGGNEQQEIAIGRVNIEPKGITKVEGFT